MKVVSLGSNGLVKAGELARRRIEDARRLRCMASSSLPAVLVLMSQLSSQCEASLLAMGIESPELPFDWLQMLG